MGLDVRYASSAELVKASTFANEKRKGWSDMDKHESEGLTFLYYSFEQRADGMPEGWYRLGGGGSFSAGSYSGYNRFREQLAALVGTTPELVWDDKASPTLAFRELIDFADNEGFIGPKTSAKLARDFAEWAGRAKVHEREDSWFLRTYKLFQTAFETAAKGGVVEFH